MNKRLIYFFVIITLVYIATRYSMTETQERYTSGQGGLDITSTCFRTGIPNTNTQYRLEDEVGVIRLDHLIYDA